MSEDANYPPTAVLPYSLEAEPLIYSWLVNRAGDNLGLELVSKVGVCASCETNRLTCAV